MSFATAASQKSVWGFSPQSIPGLQLWLDGADTTSITGTSSVTAWRNKGAAGGTTSTTNGTISSSGSINGRSALSIGTNARMTMPSLTFAQTSRSVFVVATVGNSGSFYLFLDGSTNNIDTVFFIYNGDNKLWFGSIGNAVALQAAFPAGSFNAPSIISGISAPASTRGIYVNGTALSLTANTGGTYTTGTTTTQVTGNLTYEIAYTLGELLLFDGALTTEQQQQVEGYLAAKWGLGMNLPPTHPYSSVIPILPTQIPGCQLWLDAADTSTITGTSSVTAWADKSGNGNTATSSGTANPVLTQNLINGVQGISFPNTGTSPNPKYFFDGPISLTGTSITSFVVCVPSSVTVTAASPPRILSLAAAGAVDYTSALYFVALYQYLTSFAVYRYSGGNIATVAANTPYVMTTVATPGNLAGYQNGVGPTNITASIPSGNFSVSRFRIANEFNPATSLFNGNIGEVIVFNTALSTSQRQQIESYLGRKWGIGVTNTTVAPGRYLIPANRPFYPTDISGCSLWLDGGDRSSMTFSPGTSNVTAWRDKSGNGNNGTPTTYFGGSATTIPLIQNSIGGLPAIQFTGVSSILGNLALSGSGVSMIYVFKMLSATPSAPRTIVITRPGVSDASFDPSVIGNSGTNSGTVFGYGRLFSGQSTYATTSIPLSTDTLFSCWSDGTFTFVSRNGGSTVTSQSGTLGNLNTSVYSIGSQYINDASSPFTGYIGEVLVYNNNLTTAQRQQVEQYLTWKWGLVASLPPATSHIGKLLPAFGTPFTPKSLTGMALWLDGADQSSMTFSSGSSVSSWNDKSGNARNFSNTANFPVYTATGVQFTGSTPTVLSNAAGYSATNTLTTFVVYRSTVAGTRQRYFVSGRTGNFNVFQGDSTFISAATTSLNNYQGVSFNANTTYLISQVGYSPSSISWAIDGSGSTVWQAVEAPATATSIRFSVGGEATVYFTGFIMEVLMFDTFFTRSQQQQVEGYLAWKWGLQSNLPSTHAYAKFAP